MRGRLDLDRMSAPQIVPPAMRQSAADAMLDAAYRAGVAARRIVPRGIIG